ncbi:hypothetical protein VTJ04DRAFT_174 [Mycothermus thermophilus]|uniref:uncharacterized protein n=1 Tax=Humicola insolens TaxID=85995 RepID=UPI0037446776
MGRLAVVVEERAMLPEKGIRDLRETRLLGVGAGLPPLQSRFADCIHGMELSPSWLTEVSQRPFYDA